ncbi:MAG TPA: hypothetical protein VF913_11195 [Xanthobacteraceae bacterium]
MTAMSKHDEFDAWWESLDDDERAEQIEKTFQQLAAARLVVDSGERRNGKIVWKCKS